MKSSDRVKSFRAFFNFRGSKSLVFLHIGAGGFSAEWRKNYMQITKITDNQNSLVNKKQTRISTEELQKEFDYWRAEKLLRMLLRKGLISEVEFYKIVALNRETFIPILVKLMPDKP